MSDTDDLSGRRMGEFVLRERIGEGGFGAVYCCEQPLLGREVVVKVLHRTQQRSLVIVQRFLREAQLASRLDHPYAAHVYAFGVAEPDRRLWIAMERIHGVTLAAWLAAHGPMPLGQLVPLFERIAAVVQTTHERGIVHRDLKPSNVMVIERAGELLPKLLDLGVAKLLEGTAPLGGMPGLDYLELMAPGELPATIPTLTGRTPGISTASDRSAVAHPDDGRLTQHHHAIGSPQYMAPEQWDDAVTVGPASDLYGLAVIAYEALTGRRPFQVATAAESAALHRDGQIPALGGSFPPALDRMFQRALATRPEDRWATALELAGALRAASGIGATRSDLPRIDPDVRDAWLAEAPQPLAEAMAELDDAHNANQARDLAERLVRTLVRYLLAMTLASRARVPDDHGDPALLELVRALDRRVLGLDERVRLLRFLVRRIAGPPLAHPVPELIELLTPAPDGTDGLDPILALSTDHAVTEDAVRLQLLRLIPELTRLLRKATFVLDHVLVVPRHHAAERWTGRRRARRALLNVPDGELVDGHPMLLDRAGRVCLDLWPLAQVVPPIQGAEPELFLFDGHGPRGALLIAAPSGLERHDAIARAWVATHVIAEIEARTRMREQIRIAAHQWQDRVRPDALLWRGEVLADLERWMRRTTGVPALGELEAAFVATSRRAGRRARWIRRSLVALGTAAVLAGLQYRAMRQTQAAQHDARMTQQLADLSAMQAEVEAGRQALLHDESAEAQLHLGEAYRRGDRSPGVAFMLARASQPRLAEQARFPASAGRMWSAAFSPDGRRIVTTDDKSAQVWDAASHRLLFTLPGNEVYQAVYSADGTRLVTVAEDIVKIWDTAGGALVHELIHRRKDHKPPSYYLAAISPDGKLVAAIDATGEVAQVWDAVTGAPLAELRNDASEFPTIAFSGDSRWLATSGGDKALVFDTTTWTAVATLAGPRVRTLSFDPTGPRLATGTAGGDAAIWSISGGKRLHHLREVGEPIDQIAFSPDGALVVTGGRDGTEQIWQATSGTLQGQFNALRSKILAIELDPTSKLVVAAGASGAIAVADATLGIPITMLEGPQGVRTAHFDPTSRHVIAASWDGTARVWDATSPYRRWGAPPISDDCGLVSSLEPDRRFVAIGCWDRNTRVWDTAQDRLLAELPSVTPVDGDFASALPAVSWAGDRAAIARGNTVEIYELPRGQLLRTISHPAPVNAVAFAPVGHELVSGATDGSLLVTHDGRAPIPLPMFPGGIDAVGFLPDGRVVAADARGRLRVYAPYSGTVFADLAMPTRVRLLRPSPDGFTLITIPSFTGKAAPPVMWDLERYRRVALLEGHAGFVYSARFVSGGDEIVTAGADGAARRWDGHTGRLRQIYRGSSRFLADATLTADGSMVVGGDGDGLLRFWDVAGRPLWKLQAHRSLVVGIHLEGNDLVTRGFGGDVSRWTLPRPASVIEATLAK